LLLRELLSYTLESHPDYNNLKAARDAIDKIIGSANEKKRASEHLMKIVEIHQQIAWPSEALSALLLRNWKNRAFVAQKSFAISVNSEKRSERSVFLTSDMFIVTDKGTKKDDKYVFVCKVPLKSALIWDVQDGTTEGGTTVKHAFCVVHTKKKVRLVVSTRSEAEKAQWMSKITGLMQSIMGSSINMMDQLMAKSAVKGSVIAPSRQNMGASQKNIRAAALFGHPSSSASPPISSPLATTSTTSSSPPAEPPLQPSGKVEDILSSPQKPQRPQQQTGGDPPSPPATGEEKKWSSVAPSWAKITPKAIEFGNK